MPYHVLIVEDDDSLRQLYDLYLARGRYDRTAVSSASAALKILSEVEIDVMLVDVNLGDVVSGLQLIEEVRRDNRYDHIKVVTLTSFPERYDLTYPDRIDMYLNKPVSYEELISSLNKLLENHVS